MKAQLVGARGSRVGAGPTDLVDVGVLNTPLEPALLALVDLVPEAKGCFADHADVTCARAASARGTRAGRKRFGVATAVVGIGRTVATDTGSGDGRD